MRRGCTFAGYFRETMETPVPDLDSPGAVWVGDMKRPDLDSPGRSSLLQLDLSPWLLHPLHNQPQTRRSIFFVDFYFAYSSWVVCLICGLFWVFHEIYYSIVNAFALCHA
jgi:hypothetical protein